jgi:predicted thioesterase
LQAKFAEGLISKGQYTQYTGMLKKWTVISRRTFTAKVKKLKEEVKTGTITSTDFKIKIKKLKKKVKPAVKITVEQAKGVTEVLKAKLSVQKINKKEFKIAIKRVKKRTLITKAQFKTQVSSLKIKMQSGKITPMKYKKIVK